MKHILLGFGIGAGFYSAYVITCVVSQHLNKRIDERIEFYRSQREYKKYKAYREAFDR